MGKLSLPRNFSIPKYIKENLLYVWNFSAKAGFLFCVKKSPPRESLGGESAGQY
jgi:hypothetical protein